MASEKDGDITMMSIQSTHLQSLMSKNLSTAINAIDRSTEKLASGKRINRSADDAAGLQITNRLSSSISGDGQILRNLSNGLSYLQTADGALNSITGLIQRMSQLTIQAGSGLLAPSDRYALDKEFQYLKQEIDNIAANTEIFGRFPLLGNSDQNLQNIDTIDNRLSNGVELQNQTSSITPLGYIPSGSSNVTISVDGIVGAEDDIQVFTTDGHHLVGTPLSNNSWRANGVANANDFLRDVGTENNGFSPNATYDSSQLNSGGTSSFAGMTLTYSGENDINDDGSVTPPSDGETTTVETVQLDSVTQPLIIIATGLGSYNITATWGFLGQGQEVNQNAGLRITAANTLGPKAKEYIEVEATPSTTLELGINELDLLDNQGIEQTLTSLRSALEQVGEYRGQFGALQNEILSRSRYLQFKQVNESNARQHIADTDFAEESSRSISSQIIQSASSSLLAQANTRPQQALQLLSGIGNLSD